MDCPSRKKELNGQPIFTWGKATMSSLPNIARGGQNSKECIDAQVAKPLPRGRQRCLDCPSVSITGRKCRKGRINSSRRKQSKKWSAMYKSQINLDIKINIIKLPWIRTDHFEIFSQKNITHFKLAYNKPDSNSNFQGWVFFLWSSDPLAVTPSYWRPYVPESLNTRFSRTWLVM